MNEKDTERNGWEKCVSLGRRERCGKSSEVCSLNDKKEVEERQLERNEDTY